ncbi:hypothetical protein PIB30_029194 [Stylosanthes scabra]|uniref:F-box domain-containing protein n=1 Tax=Stylosanthes scabra TaxID=79078 RepID=A0ABU6QAP5_9FABA|nr:hypothetical protein [Stylosanthes scabra]
METDRNEIFKKQTTINEVLALINGLSDNMLQVVMKIRLAHFPDEIMWKIFLKADHKTIGRCRSLNKSWNFWLKCPDFLKEHWAENKWRRRSIILGVDNPPGDGNSQWFYDSDLDSRDQVQLNIPININQGMYTMVGSDHGILCMRISQAGHHWNPLTRKREYVFDEAKKHFNYRVCVYAFGFPAESTNYQIVHVYKRNYEDVEMRWTLYDQTEGGWSKPKKFSTDASKLGPTYVIENGVFH